MMIFVKESIERFLDAEGRLKAWPAKRAMQKLMIEYVSGKFEHGRVYSEKEINAILTKWHTFGDYFILRRGLIEEGLMVRTPNGAEYRRSEVVLAENAENSRSDISLADNPENSRSDVSPAEKTEISFPETIDDYIATQPEAVQPTLHAVRAAIREALPDAREKISWRMPTFYRDKNIIHFAAFKNHLGIYPGDEGVRHFSDRIREFKSSKGAIQFPYNQPIPLQLIAEIAKWCDETGNHH